MKTFKKSMVLAVVLMTGLLASSVSAESVVSKTHTSLYSKTQCDGGEFAQVMYAGSKGHEMIDTFTESNTSFVWQINTPNSWISTYNAIPNALNMPILDYFSNGKPHNISTVVVMGSKAGASVTSTYPSTYKRSDIAAQVVYHVERTRWNYKSWNKNTLQFLDFNNRGVGTQNYSYNASFPKATYSDNECMNVHIGFCGDGILDNSTANSSKNINASLNGWELCDPKDPNKTGWGNGGCDTSCKPINKTPDQPKCNSQYNGQTLENLTAGSHLCSVGTYANFQFDATRNTWTWTCNGVAGTTPVQCSAKKKTTPKPDPIYDLALTKTLVDQKTGYALGDELTFRITVYNQGDLVARNLEISDYLPAGLELIDPNWTLVNGITTTKIVGPIAPKDVAVVTMKVKIKSDFKGSRIINKAEISKDNASDYGTTDVDSTPDQNKDNDCFIDGKHIVTGNGKDKSKCDETTDEDDHDGVEITISKPTIKKDLQELGKIYEVGDLVGFVMPFANNTAETIYNVSIKDFLPKNLEYVSSEISGVGPTVHTTTKNADGVTVDLWSGFNLLPGQKGVLYLTGRVLESNYDSRLNTVGIYTNDILVESDSERYDLGDRKVIIEKTVDKSIVRVGENTLYKIKVTVVSGSYDELIVTDTLPKGLVYQEGTYQLTGLMANTEVVSFSTGKNAQGLDVLTWRLRFPNKISAGKSFTIALYAQLTEKTQAKYTNIACVEDPKKPNDPPICDPEDIRPPRPGGSDPTMQIKKYVNKTLVEAGREDVLMTGFASGQTGYFTLEAQDATAGMSEFTITDTVDGNLTYIDSSTLLNNAFTGVFLRGIGNATSYKYTTTVTVEKLTNNTTKLTWKVMMTEGQFLPGDKYRVQFMATVKGDHRNVAIITYPGGSDDDDASVKTDEVKLTIKKYVSASVDKDYNDTSATISPNTTAYFKLVVTGATNALTGFRVEDTLKNSDLLYLSDSEKLANNAFTGVITFGANNPSKPAYTITPKVVTGATETKLTWTVKMADGSYFMPGDSLEIIFMTKKISNTTNTAHVYYPKRDGTEGHSEDPASVTYSSGGGGWGWGGGGGSYSPSCGNGRKDGYELCDLGSANGTSRGIIGSNGHLFSNLQGNSGIDYINTKYAGYSCTSSCGLKKDGEQIAPKCFNLQNGSISIMKGEVLPFYWNLDGIAGKTTVEKKREWLNTHYVENSTKADTTPKIDISTMKCYFKVYGPGMTEVYSFNAPCFNPNWWSAANNVTYPSIKEYINQNREWWLGGSELSNQGVIKNVFSTLDNQGEFPILFPLSSKLYISNFGQGDARVKGALASNFTSRIISTFGEYKIALEQIDYEYVSKDAQGKLTTTKQTFDDRICEVDFAVTDPYMIQRSPYGIGNKATVALSKYQLMNGTSFMTQFFKTENMSAKEYKTPANIKSLFNTFKNKYAQLAKSVSWKSDLKKVPGKAIYLVSGKEINLTNLISDSSKPFTLIAVDPKANITISESITTNAMIMTQGTITFDASKSCNGNKTKYGHAGQMVQGIFYAGDGFKSSNHAYLKNTEANLNDNARCNYGNLHIKGVAIGDLSDVVANRRSELYTWFEWTAGGKYGAEKVQKVIYGASVLVDYNPTLRGNLPPGANEFNKALEVYRK